MNLSFGKISGSIEPVVRITGVLHRRWLICLLAALLIMSACSSPPARAPAHLSPRSIAKPATSPSPPRAIRSRATAAAIAPAPGIGSRKITALLPFSGSAKRTANDLAGTFAPLDLQPPVGSSSSLQPLKTIFTTTTNLATALLLNDRPLRLGSDYTLVPTTAQGRFNAAVVFAGFGITRKDYDDYSGVKATGKVVLAMRREPGEAHGNIRPPANEMSGSDEVSILAKARNAAVHGAVALLLVSPPQSGGADVVPGLRVSIGSSLSPIPVIFVTRRVANLLLTIAGEPGLADFESAINALNRPKSVVLPRVKIAGEVSIQRRTAPLRNATGRLPGSGPLVWHSR